MNINNITFFVLQELIEVSNATSHTIAGNSGSVNNIFKWSELTGWVDKHTITGYVDVNKQTNE